MNDQAVQTQEWNDPSNWSRKAWLGVYFNKRDPRLWVRKPVPAMGWTLNFARPFAAIVLLAIVFTALSVAVLASR